MAFNTLIASSQISVPTWSPGNTVMVLVTVIFDLFNIARKAPGSQWWCVLSILCEKEYLKCSQYIVSNSGEVKNHAGTGPDPGEI